MPSLTPSIVFNISHAGLRDRGYPFNVMPDDGSGSAECELSTFGCCPDGVTSSSGPDGEGCEDLTPTSTLGVELVGCDHAIQTLGKYIAMHCFRRHN